MHLDDGFEPYYQQTNDLCFPVAIKNILDHVCKKHEKPDMRLGVSKLNTLCGYDGRFGLGLQDTDAAILRLNKHLRKYGYFIVEKTATDINFLEKILADENCSAPIVSVHPMYFTEQNQYCVIEDPDLWHQLIIKSINKEKNIIEIIDTLKPQIVKSSNQQFKAELPLLKFLKCWYGANRCVIWIERLRGQTPITNVSQKRVSDTAWSKTK